MGRLELRKPFRSTGTPRMGSGFLRPGNNKPALPSTEPVVTEDSGETKEVTVLRKSSTYLSELLMYRWRYSLGYLIITTAVVWMLFTAALYIPGGLSNSELQSTVISSNLSLHSLTPAAVINFPYHALQHFSFMLFGVTTLSIKLPSLLVALLSVAGMLILLRMWFAHNIAVLTMIIVITTGQFLLIAQRGTPSIMYIFWSTWLIVASMMVARLGTSRSNLFWKIMLCALITLSLYTPLSIYVVAALVVASFLHPHLRFMVRQLAPKKMLAALLCGLLLLTPLIQSIIADPSIGLTLLGVPTKWSGLSSNSSQLFSQYFDFFSTSTGALLTPIYGLGSMLLIAMGAVRLFSTKYTGRSYVITIWLVMLLPILIINPDYTSVTFVPVMLLMAMGIRNLLGHWYGLFPRNPYARVVGLIPLSILIASLVFAGIDHYTNGYRYDPRVASNYSTDLKILNRYLDKAKTPATIITDNDQFAFYSAATSRLKNVSVMRSGEGTPKPGAIILTRGVAQVTPYPGVHTILTSSMSSEADRFYVYR